LFSCISDPLAWDNTVLHTSTIPL